MVGCACLLEPCTLLPLPLNLKTSYPISYKLPLSNYNFRIKRIIHKPPSRFFHIKCKSDSNDSSFPPSPDAKPSTMSPLERAMAYKKERELQKNPKSSAAFDRAASYLKSKTESSSKNEANKLNQSIPPNKESNNLNNLNDSKQVTRPLNAPAIEIIRGNFNPERSNNTFNSESKSMESIQNLESIKTLASSPSSSSLTSVSSDSNPEASSSIPDSNQSKQKNESNVNSIPSVDDQITRGFDSMDIYRQQQEDMISALNSQTKKNNPSSSSSSSPSSSSSSSSSSPISSKPASKKVMVEIITRDGIIKRELGNPDDYFDQKSIVKSNRISDVDFIGLGFSEKKDSAKGDTPAGLRAPMSMPRGTLPEVEIITRDAPEKDKNADSDGDMYKPKVSTWGVFPRPRDISQTYGGGRTLPPGSALESEEEKMASQKRTKELLAEYMRKSGLEMDSKTKVMCEEALKKGEGLMDEGMLNDAMEYFEKIEQLTVFKSEIHGRALLMKALCLDSQAKSGDAKLLYDKISTHPNDEIRKKARNMLFGFQAAENLKVGGGYEWDANEYRPYFDKFASNYNTVYKRTEKEREEDEQNRNDIFQYLPYFLLIFSPVFLVLVLAFTK